MTNKSRFIFILTTGHSGGTLLNLLLGTSPTVFPAGESLRVSNLSKIGDQPIAVQTFWKEALQKLSEQGYPPSNLTDDFAKSAPVSFWRLWVDVLASVSTAPIIADKTLSLNTIRTLCDAKLVDPYFVHLTRDPRAVVFSYSRKSGSSWRHARSWSKSHRELERFTKDRENVCRLRYEDLVSQPTRHVRSLLLKAGAYFDLDMVDGMPNDLEHRGLGDQIYENVIFAGNRMRFGANRTQAKIEADETFLQEMSKLDWAITNSLCRSRMLRYGYSLDRTKKLESVDI